MTILRFSVPAEVQQQTLMQETSEFIDVEVLALYPYHVEADFYGNEAKITDEMVRSVCSTYNESVKKKWLLFKAKSKALNLLEVPLAQNRLDHSNLVQHVVGHVVGNMKIKEREGIPYLYATLRVKGKENVQKVKDGIYEKVSIGFNPKTFETDEISWVSAGALPEAGVTLGAGRQDPTTSHPVKLSKMQVENILLNKIRSNQLEIDRKRLDFEVDALLTGLIHEGKIFPVDKLRLSKQLESVDPNLRKDFISALSDNLGKVIDYGRVSSEKSLNISLGAFQMKTDGDGKKTIAEHSREIALRLAKGKEAKMGEKGDKEIEKEEAEKTGAELSKKKKMSKKDIDHAMSLSKDEAKEYLCNFAEGDEEDEEEKKKMAEGVKHLGKFEDTEAFKTLQKQNQETNAQLIVLSRNTEECIKLFNQLTIDLAGGK